MVTEQFQVDWATVLVSSFSTIVIRFDGHGSGFRGTNLLHKVRRKLGKLEERDQLEALRSGSVRDSQHRCSKSVLSLTHFTFIFRFISKEPYIDKSRMGVYGRVRRTCGQ